MNGRERGERLRDAIYAAYEAANQQRRSRRLGPSWLGHQCNRSLWFKLRWADDLEQFSGRMLRLFETGHSQEDRLINDLKRVGAQTMNRDPESADKQIGIEDFDGHLAGFIDVAAFSVPHALQDWVIGECKTHSAKSFKKIVDDGVEIGKPEHYVQLQLYLHKMELAEGLYLAVCKDTDELHCEFVPYNAEYCRRLMAKAEMAIFSKTAPSKIHKSPDFYVCKFCDAVETCHNGKLPERSCRTCRECVPLRASDQTGTVEHAAWGCLLHEVVLTLDQQREGCSEHRYHRDMVGGTSNDHDAPSPAYRMNDGSEFVDSGPAEDGLKAKPPAPVAQ